MLDHATIEEEQIAERYVMGKLPPDEATRFEEHYLSCPECLDRLELAESMERGFKRAAGQDAARVAATRQLALVAWLARLGRSRQVAALLMTVVVVALLPGLVGFWEIRQRGRELADARSELEQERQKSVAGSRSAAETAKKLEGSRRELDKERQARATAEEQLKAARQPQVNVPVLELAVERGAAEPTHKVALPRSPGWIFLALDVLGVEAQHPPSYRVILRDASGKEILRREGLRANERDLLYLILPSTLLAPGDYVVTVEGVGGAAPVTFRFTFRAQPAG
jgi:hypothetical protein